MQGQKEVDLTFLKDPIDDFQPVSFLVKTFSLTYLTRYISNISQTDPFIGKWIKIAISIFRFLWYILRSLTDEYRRRL